MKKYNTPESLEIEMGIHYEILNASGLSIMKENGEELTADGNAVLSNRRSIWEDNDNPFGR